MTEYYGYSPEKRVVTLYRLERDEKGLVTGIQGANATTSWKDTPGIFEDLMSDPCFMQLSTSDAQALAKQFHVTV